MAVFLRIIPAVAGVLVAVSAAGAAGFQDPAGDGSGAPDVTDVSASATAGGRATFVVRTADAGTWDGAAMDVMVDSDADYGTGHDDGVDYVFTLRADRTFAAGRWNGRAFAAYGSSATGSLAGDTATISVPVAELGDTRRLTFAVLTFRGSARDEAPDGSFAPGTPPRWQLDVTAAPRVVGLAATFAPARPVHARRFAVRSVTGRLSGGGSRRLTGLRCTARLRGKALGAGCSWRIPADARGRRLAVTVRAAGVSRVYRFTVG